LITKTFFQVVKSGINNKTVSLQTFEASRDVKYLEVIIIMLQII